MPNYRKKPKTGYLLTIILLMALLLPAAGSPAQAAPSAQAATSLVINEIMQNPAAVFDSFGEWFELYNPAAEDVDINGWTIKDNDIDSHVIDNGAPLVIPAGGYLVLGSNADTTTNGGVTVAYSYGGSWFLSNSADEVVLENASGVEIDRVEYDDGLTFPDPNGAAMALKDPALDNNAGANWCTASTSYGDGDMGTPGAANDCDSTPPSSGELIINEIMQNPAAVNDGAGEWFELYNPNTSPVDINGWTIKDNDSDSHVINNGGPLIIPAGGYLVLGNNADTATNGGVTVAYSYGSSWYLGNGSDEVVLEDTSGVEIDRVEYDNGATFPDPNGAAMALKDPALDNNAGANWCTAGPSYGDGDSGTPGAANVCAITIGSCGDPATLIHDVQGAGMSSPLSGIVVIEGVVVGDFQEYGQLGGFFVQEEDGEADTDDATSEGIFVYHYSTPVSVGDVVRVMGTVTEYWGLTEIVSVSDLDTCGTGVVTPTMVSKPATSINEWEAYEGMLITFPEMTVTDNYDQGRWGEITLAFDGRLYSPTNVVEPGPAAIAMQADNDLRVIQLDDGISSPDNPVPAPYFVGTKGPRAGDTVSNLIGVLGYAYGDYEVHPTAAVVFNEVNPRPVTPAPVSGEVRVASMNVLNYFTTIDEGESYWICGPSGDMECRGADSNDEFIRQRNKIISAIVGLDADVIGLMEIENNGYDPSSAIADLVAGLNAVAGAGTYAYIDPGVPFVGTDAIAVGLLYRPGVVTPFGTAAILDSTVDPTFIDTKNRPVLAQTFEENATGALFTVAVNHLKSKGSACGITDPDTGDGQGNCNITRMTAATALVNWLATDPTGSGDPDFLIIGDLNAYAMEDPIDAIKASGYTDLIQLLAGPNPYSYTYYGQAGYLDHALAIENLAEQVSGLTQWHINADEPSALDYNTYNQLSLYTTEPYRSSDHDPVLVGLLLEFEVPIDIKPGGEPNSINVGANGKVPVALLSTDRFDATAVDPATITFAGAPVIQKNNGSYMASIEDVNDDGLYDLMLHFETQLLDLGSGATEAMLEGMTSDGRRIYGTDSVRIVPRHGDTCAPATTDAEFMWGLTYGDLLSLQGRGNTWRQLAQNYIEAELNAAGGAVFTSGEQSSIDLAYTLLGANNPNGSLRKSDRLVFQQLANVLKGINAGVVCPQES
jgi:predicted extracellular nuclease